MGDAQVASDFAHAVQRCKHLRLVRSRRVFLAASDHSMSSGFAIAEDGSIIFDDGESDNNGGIISSSSQPAFSLTTATSTTSDQPNRQTIQTVSTTPVSTPSTKALSLPQTSPVVYTSQDTPRPVSSPSLTTVLMSSALPPPTAKSITITEIPVQTSQFPSEMPPPPSIFFTTTTLLPSRSTPTVVATTTATRSNPPVDDIISDSALVHPVTITTIVPASGTNSQLSTTIVMLTTDPARSTARGAGKAITNAGSGTNPASGSAALPSGLPSSDPEFGLKVSHNPPLIIGLILGSILLLSACAAGAGWFLRARRRWQDHRIAAFGIDTRNSFGNASALFVPDPTWYREESKESDGALQHEGGMDTRRTSVSLKAGPSQKTGNEAVRGVGTFNRVARDSFGDPFAPSQSGGLPSIARCFESSLIVTIANINPYFYNYQSTMNYARNPDPEPHDRPIPIPVVPGRTRSGNALLSLPTAISSTGRFSKRSAFGAASRLPTPAFGERTLGKLSGNWRESMMGLPYRTSVIRVGYDAYPPGTVARPYAERAENTSITQVGTVDQNYERVQKSSLRVVGELTRDTTVGDLGSTVGISTATRVEEKLKRMREERRELERV